MTRQTLSLDGRTYVVVPRDEFEALEALATMPEFPPPDADGNYPAAEYMRVSIARDIIRERVRLGLSQAELARRAGIRVETLCRIETAQRDAAPATIDKIDRALQAAERPAKTTTRSGGRRKKR